MKKDIKFVKRCEDMTGKELKERIEMGMKTEIENRIMTVPYLGGEKMVIELVYPELSARCPMTGIKDTYKIIIRYIPQKVIPELKSLKFYFLGYEDIPISHEHITAKIYKEFNKAIKPEKIWVKVYVANRGQIKTTIEIPAVSDLSKWDGRREEKNYLD